MWTDLITFAAADVRRAGGERALLSLRRLFEWEAALTDPYRDLCCHHRIVMRAWRREHPHETTEDHAVRVGHYARACRECLRERA